MRAIGSALTRALWRGLAPIHRPLIRRFDARVERMLDERLSAELEARLVPTLTAALESTAQTVQRLDVLIEHVNHSTRETDAALNTLLDECFRLREQVENLQRIVHQDGENELKADTLARLSLMEHDERCDSFDVAPPHARGQAS